MKRKKYFHHNFLMQNGIKAKDICAIEQTHVNRQFTFETYISFNGLL